MWTRGRPRHVARITGGLSRRQNDVGVAGEIIGHHRAAATTAAAHRGAVGARRSFLPIFRIPIPFGSGVIRVDRAH